LTTHPFAPVDTHVHLFLIPFYQRWSLQPSRIFEPICRSFDGREESRMIHRERRPRRAQTHSRGSTTLSATTYRCGRAKPQTKRKLGSHCRDGSGKRFSRACWRCIRRLTAPRLLGFGVCLIGAAVCFFVAFFITLPLLAIRPAKFALSFRSLSFLFSAANVVLTDTSLNQSWEFIGHVRVQSPLPTYQRSQTQTYPSSASLF
jgi:hypothetical protein